MVCERVTWAFSAHKRLVSMTIACEVQAVPHMPLEDHAGHLFSGRALATVLAAYSHCALRCLAGKAVRMASPRNCLGGGGQLCALLDV